MERRNNMSEIAERYNRIYTEHEVSFGKGKPESTVSKIPTYIASGKVLELGAGEGRNTLFLAEHGFDVTATDISSVGLEKLRKRAEAIGLHIQTVREDICSVCMEEFIDVLVCTYVLQDVPRLEALDIIKKMQEQTNGGGIHTISAFTKESDFYRNKPQTNTLFLEKEELKNLYSGWDILHYEEIPTEALAKKADGTPMINTTAKILARKKEA